MRHLVVESSVAGVSAIIEAPEWLPMYDIDTEVVVNVKDGETEIQVEGIILGFNLSVSRNKDFNEYEIIYSLQLEDGSIMDVHEEEILERYPSTNSLEIEYHEG